MIDEYTRILQAAAEMGDERSASESVNKLIAHLKSTGRVKMLPEILRQLRKIAARRRSLAPVVEVASEREAVQALVEARAEGINAPMAHVNRTLIKGWRARHGSQTIDRSAKRALVDIYKNITAGNHG